MQFLLCTKRSPSLRLPRTIPPLFRCRPVRYYCNVGPAFLATLSALTNPFHSNFGYVYNSDESDILRSPIIKFVAWLLLSLAGLLMISLNDGGYTKDQGRTWPDTCVKIHHCLPCFLKNEAYPTTIPIPKPTTSCDWLYSTPQKQTYDEEQRDEAAQK